MEPDVAVTLGTGKSHRPKPSPLVRLTEAAGLMAVVWGIGTGPLWLTGLGAAMIVGSYAAYRRNHGRMPPGEVWSGDIGADRPGNGD